MKAVALSPRVAAACDDLERAAGLLAASRSDVAKAAGETCAATAHLWRQGWAPDPLPARDRAILRLAQAAIAADTKGPTP